MQDSSMLPQGHVEPTPLRAWAKAYPRAVRSGPLRRDSAAEATIRVSPSRRRTPQRPAYHRERPRRHQRVPQLKVDVSSQIPR